MFDGLRDSSLVVHDRRDETQHLLDRVVDQCGIVRKHLRLVAMLEQQQQSTAQEVARGLGAARDEELPPAEELIVGQRGTVECGVYQHAEDVVAGLRASSIDVATSVVHVLREHVRRRGLRRALLRIRRADGGARPLEDRGTIVVRDTEHLAGDMQWQLGGECFGGVTTTRGDERVDEFARDVVRGCLECEGSARREATADETAPRGVIGWIRLEQRDRAWAAATRIAAGDGELCRREVLPIAVELADESVARDHVASAATAVGMPVHGVLGAQAREQVVGHADDEDIGVVERARINRHRGG